MSLVLIVAACDSRPGININDIDGSYNLETLRFDADGLDVRVNVRDSLQMIQVDFFADDREYEIRYRFPEQTSTQRVRGSFQLERTTLQMTVVEADRDRAARLLLPRDGFPLRVQEEGDRLTADLQRDQANLEPYGINQRLNGRLTVRLNKP